MSEARSRDDLEQIEVLSEGPQHVVHCFQTISNFPHPRFDLLSLRVIQTLKHVLSVQHAHEHL